MKLRKRLKQCLTFTLMAAFLLQVTACGTLMHPERKGQTGGRIDAGIAILDGLGLLFYIIPGVIAFAVDFSYGTIYLPSGEKSSLEDGNPTNFTAVPMDKNVMGMEEIESVVFKQTGISIDMDGQDVKVIELSGITELIPKYTEVVTHHKQIL
jgi:hypothetical protein